MPDVLVISGGVSFWGSGTGFVGPGGVGTSEVVRVSLNRGILAPFYLDGIASESRT